MWNVVLWVLAGIALPLFLVQQGFWIAVRRKKIAVPKWRGYAKCWLGLGVFVLVGGVLAAFFGKHTVPGVQAAQIGITGGALNAAVATLHIKTVDLLMRGKKGR